MISNDSINSSTFFLAAVKCATRSRESEWGRNEQKIWSNKTIPNASDDPFPKRGCKCVGGKENNYLSRSAAKRIERSESPKQRPGPRACVVQSASRLSLGVFDDCFSVALGLANGFFGVSLCLAYSATSAASNFLQRFSSSHRWSRWLGWNIAVVVIVVVRR